MEIEYTVESFIKDNIILYVKTEYLANNFYEIFVERAKKVYSNEVKGFLKTRQKTDHEFYTEFVNDEKQLGDDQISFFVDLDKTRDFCIDMKRLISYSKIQYTTVDANSVHIISVNNEEFYTSKLKLSSTDIRNISVAKYFIKKYF